MEEDPAVQIFGTEDPDLYGALSLEASADAEAIKKSYRKLALLYHPDKLSGKNEDEREAATLKFQQIGYAYAVLSDADRRKRFDATGRTDEGLLNISGSWDEYFKELWQGEVNANTIDDFFKQYQGSEEEMQDVMTAYNDSQGDIEHILSHCMSADSLTAEDHFTKLINTAISKGQLKSTKAWKHTLKDTKGRERRQKEATAEAREAEEMAKELGVHDKLFGKASTKGKGKSKSTEEDDLEGLRALIQQRGKARMDANIEALEAKYSAMENSKSSKKRKAKEGKAQEQEDEEDVDEEISTAKRQKGMPTEAEFAAIQAKIMQGKQKGGDNAKKGKSKK